MILASESDSQAHTIDVPTNGIETRVYIIVKKKKKKRVGKQNFINKMI